MINPLQINLHISKSVDWLYNTWKKNKTGVGWSITPDNPRIMQWGGTLDAIRALVFAGANLNNPMISESVEWLIQTQNDDGGWCSWEIKNSCVDVTCWIVITLKMLEMDIYQANINKAIQYIISNQKKDGSWGAYREGESRVYATLLAIWALIGIDKSSMMKGINWIIDARNDDGAWGFKYKDNASNVPMAAIALIVLGKASYITSLENCQKSINYIYSKMHRDYSWEPIHELYLAYDNENFEQSPTTCNHFTGAWAIMALISVGENITNIKLMRAISVFLKSQNANGSWCYLKYNKTEYTWCLANGLWALIYINQMIQSPITVHQWAYKQNDSRRRNIALLILLCILILETLFLSYTFLKDSIDIAKIGITVQQVIITIKTFWETNQTLIISSFISLIVTIIGGILVHRFTIEKKRSHDH